MIAEASREVADLIDYDVSAPPFGILGMQRLLTAVENADAGDESEWIEFKADLDPTSKAGAAALAKAIVAFANRDPERAQRWCKGHAYVVVGLEPGNLVGAPMVDPADLHNKVNALLASPAPEWDPTPVGYRDKVVIVITVAPPRSGDPIACIGKSSDDVVDGNVYVRVPGKSERARAADIRRLSARLAPADETLRELTVTASGSVCVVEYPDDWLERWIEDEKTKLLAPLEPVPEPEDLRSSLHRELLGRNPAYESILRLSESARSTAGLYQGAFTVKHEEERTEEAYRAEVAAYLRQCRDRLAGALEKARAAEATPVTFSVTNGTARNFASVLTRLHVEGDVYGYEWQSKFSGWKSFTGKRPRAWGPWTESTMPNANDHLSRPHLMPHVRSPAVAEVPRPRPRIDSGGSVSIECVPVDLRPGATAALLTLYLVADKTVASDARVTWSATATDADGELADELSIPLSDDRAYLDLNWS